MISTFAISFVMINIVSATSIFIQAGIMFFVVYSKMILSFLVVGIIAIEVTFEFIQKLTIKYYTHA
mgnify:CR=1 FL=1